MKIKNLIAGTIVLFLLLVIFTGCKDLTGPQGDRGAEGFDAGEGPFGFTIASTEIGAESLKGLEAFSSALREALESLPESAGENPDNPVGLKLTGLDLFRINELIALYGSLTRYTALDLSACKGVMMIATPSGVYLKNKEKIVSLKLPGSVATLETSLAKEGTPFGFTGLRALGMPGVKIIGANAFDGCAVLEDMNLPELGSTGDNAFRNCKSIAIVDLPELVSIGASAFYGCTALETVNLPKLESIGNTAFRGCTALTEADFPEVTSVETYTFYGCTALETVNLPKLESIGNTAFRGCTALTEITLGATPPSTVGNNIFQTVTSSTNISLKVPNDSVSAYNDWLTANTAKLAGPTITVSAITP
jgi:hypothetical protein